MSNSFWNFVTRMVSGSLAKADDVNTNFDGVTAGFTLVETELGKSIRITNEAGVTDITAGASARALKVMSFDENGDLNVSTSIGDWKGDHADAAGTDYEIRDFVKDAAGSLGQDNIYICTVTHTSTGSLTTDTANWDLLIDVEAVAASEAAAAASAAESAASFASFDERYLGAKASAPTLDNEGEALITGAMYFNSTSDLMFWRTSGATWGPAVSTAANISVADAGGHLTASDAEAAFAEIAVLTKHLTVTGAIDLDAIEAGADVTDTANVTAAGAVMDSEVDADIKTLVLPASTTITAFAQTMLDDADAAAVRATINVAEAGSGDYIHPNHSGDVTSVADGAQTIAADAVSNVKLANMVQALIKGRQSGGGTGDPEDLTAAQVRTIINVEDNADVTDTSNVTSAGALMDSEVDADLKTLVLPASTTITAFAQTFLDDADAAAVRATLDVDQAGAGGYTHPDHTGHVTSDADGAQTLVVAAITGQSETITIAGADELLINDGGAIRRIAIDNLIAGQVQAMTSGLVSTDEFLVSDATFVKRMDASVMAAYVAGTTAIDDAITTNAAVALNTAKADNADHSGDVSGDTVLTIGNSKVTEVKINNDAVTNAKLSNMTQTTIKGRASGAGTGDPSDLTASQVRTLINVEDDSDKTDTSNVTAAGAVMDSEIDQDIKSLSLPSNTTISAFGRTLIDDAASSNARNTLDVDQSGTDNSNDNATNSQYSGLVTNANHSGQVTGSSSLSLANSAITGQTAGTTVTGTDELLYSDGGTIKRMDVNRLIVGQSSSLTSGLAGTDELLVSDAGTIKKMDVSVLLAYIQSNPAAGRVVQTVNVTDGTVATGTGTVNFDNTIPQNTEGNEFMTLAITPNDTANILKIDVVVFTSMNVTATYIAALFKDSDADAIGVGSHYQLQSSTQMGMKFTVYKAAGSTSAQTYKLRAGSDQAGTCTFNGTSSGAQFGGAMASSITITEYTQ